MADIIGIDLGTTKSAVAVWRDGAPQIIADAEGHIITPSVVAVNPDDGRWEIGHRALSIAVEHPRAAIYSIKRFIGRRYHDDVVQESLHRLRILYELEEARRKGGIEVDVGNRHLAPQEVSAKVLQRLKAMAEAALGHEVTQAVITVPAYFNDSQRQATRDAGRIAGLEVRRVLNEPTAACLAFGYQRLAQERRTVAVYDLGGGTFDISILEVGRGPFRVRATNGDTFLGGDDLNWRIVDWALAQIGGAEQHRLQDDLHALARLRIAAEQAKKELSAAAVGRVCVAGPLTLNSDIRDLDLALTQADLEALAEAWIERTLKPCAQALSDARMRPSDIQEVLLVGGQTRMPAIRRAVREFFGVEPNISLNPEEVVALGAAVQAGILAGETTGLKLADVVPLSLGVNTRGLMDVLIPRNTPTPYFKHKIYSTVYPNQESVEIKVYQGERPMVEDNIKLGEFLLKGITPAPAGEPEIKVTFQVDQDGILHVSAVDLRTEISKEITITDSVRLSEEEIARMVREAEEHDAEYAAQREQAERQMQADQLAGRLKALLREHERTMPAELAAAIRALAPIAPPDEAMCLAELQDLWRQVNDAVS